MIADTFKYMYINYGKHDINDFNICDIMRYIIQIVQKRRDKQNKKQMQQ